VDKHVYLTHTLNIFVLLHDVAFCYNDSHEEINIIQYVCMNPPAKFDSISVIIYIYICHKLIHCLALYLLKQNMRI
jgi:hypothetical protein